jgi:integrase
MTLADLVPTLISRDALSTKQVKRAKDYQTALRYLAAALGHASPSECSVDAAIQDGNAWLKALASHWETLAAQGRTISASTMRNTRNSLRVVFRAAEAAGLLAAPLPAPLLTRRPRRVFTALQRATAPYRATYHPTTGPRHFWLAQDEWPTDIQAGWQDYQALCDGRIRETTFHTYMEHLRAYLGYLRHIIGKDPHWEDCFDPTQIRGFVRWHATRVGQRRTSAKGLAVIRTAAAIARVIAHSNAGELRTMHVEIQRPDPVHNKRAHHWISLAQLEAVADACLQEGRGPFGGAKLSKYPGAKRALQFQKGVILKLLVRVPLRQRNVRELRLEENLYEDGVGHWHLHFQGSDLKVGMRGGRVNEYHVDLTEHTEGLISVLKEWIKDYRPRLPGAAISPFLFVTQSGRPFTADTLLPELKDVVAMRTGKRFYPHLIRSIWATEYLTHPKTHGDYQTAATMLGDNLQTVIQNYYDVVNKDHHVKAKSFLASALKPETRAAS